jgi:DNA modification methylase
VSGATVVLGTAVNTLYYGDNLDVLRRHIAPESVDLVYLDPPFKSNQDYNVLFAEHSGKRAAAQIKAFEDTWCWDEGAARAFEQTVECGGRVADALRALRTFLGESDMLAYLSMMAPRLVELHRVMKATASIYLHCDPTASHYLKMLMDAVFGPQLFLNEVIWKRTTAHSSSKRYGPVHDVIFYYAKSHARVWNNQYLPYSEEYLTTKYRHLDADGRRYRLSDIMAAGVRHGSSGTEWRGLNPSAKGCHWKFTTTTLEKLDAAGRLYWSRKEGGMPQYKRYLDEVKGVVLQDIWDDIQPINSQARERLGYPTQKPEELLERIINASSNEGDVVLDPFCGCGTAVAAAQKLKRRWIGIDITHLAIALIRHRLTGHEDVYGSLDYEVIGEPVSLPDAEALAASDQYQFQWWALGLVGARPTEQKKGADRGIDGRLYFHDEERGPTKQIIFSVKAGNVTASQVRDLRGVIEREKAQIGVFITMQEPTQPMRKEAASAGFYEIRTGKDFVVARYPHLQILTVAELLSGKTIDAPSRAQRVDVTYKRAPKAERAEAEQLTLDAAVPLAAEHPGTYRRKRR